MTLHAYSIACIVCSTDVSIENGNVYINRSVAVYSCKSGYRLAKESKRHCKNIPGEILFTGILHASLGALVRV